MKVRLEAIAYEIEMLNLITGLNFDYSKQLEGYKLTNSTGGIDMSNYRMTKKEFYRSLLMLNKTLRFALDQPKSKLFNFGDKQQ